jgi:hypothetical protein
VVVGATAVVVAVLVVWPVAVAASTADNTKVVGKSLLKDISLRLGFQTRRIQ